LADVDDLSIAAAGESLPPAIPRARGAWSRWLALAGFVVSALSLGWTFWQLERGRSLEEPDIPPLLCGAVVGLATTVLAMIGLRGASRRMKVGLILMGLCALASAGWYLFTAWMVAIFPPC
jgi:uncharacterized membrane protein (UPF0136 family)